jgi:hypothetical protein
MKHLAVLMMFFESRGCHVTGNDTQRVRYH